MPRLGGDVGVGESSYCLVPNPTKKTQGTKKKIQPTHDAGEERVAGPRNAVRYRERKPEDERRNSGY